MELIVPIAALALWFLSLVGVVAWATVMFDHLRRDKVRRDDYDRDIKRIDARLATMGDSLHRHGKELHLLVNASKDKP